MTKSQFDAALKRNGMQRAPMGYVQVTAKLAVYPGNAGPRLRTQLAYLIAAKEREQAKAAQVGLP
jgi:hypothetical protein